MSRRYRRYFVMLEGEDLGFELSNSKEPKGYGKIEVRNEQGTLSLHCQNLKKVDPIGARYRWYLVNTRKTGEPIIVDVGPMQVDENGKGELIWEFNGENVKGSNSKIDQFNILALIAEEKGDKKEFSAPLVGYIDKEKTEWKNHLEKHLSVPAKKSFVPSQESKLQPPKKEDAVVAEKKPKPTLESKEKETPKPSFIAKDQSTEKPSPAIAPKEKAPISQEKPVKEEKTTKGQGTITPKEKEEAPKIQIDKKANEIKEAKESKEVEGVKESTKAASEPKLKVEGDKETVKTKATYDSNPEKKQGHQKQYSPHHFEEEIIKAKKKSMTAHVEGLQAYVESTLKNFPKADPFTKGFDDYQWWQIQYDQQTMYRSAMPFIGYIEGQHHPYYYYYPSEYQRLIYVYQHYLFGMCYDNNQKVRYYVYGIPGSKLQKDQPYRGSTGFINWYSCNGDQSNPHASGYWLLHIDGQTGEVVTP